jgi:hypothetical protein
VEYILLASGATAILFGQMLLGTPIVYCELPGFLLEDKTGAIFLLKAEHIHQVALHMQNQKS